MSEELPKNSIDLKEQLRKHLDGLRAAGIDWVPIAVQHGQQTAPQRGITPQQAEPALVPLPPSSAPAGTVPEKPVVQAAPVAPGPTALPVFQTSLFAGATAQPPAVADSVEQRLQELTVLKDCVAECRRCPHLASTRRHTVFGVGPIDPDLCFIGEAPGATEDQRGEPFVGDAGQLLNRILAACGIKREEVYICNIIKCRPPGNRTPNAEEASNCREFLEKQLALVRPKFICCLGACAAQNLLGTSQSIGKMRGRVFNSNGIPVVCTYHPSYLLRIPEEKKKQDEKKKVWEDMKRLLTLMKKPIPQKS